MPSRPQAVIERLRNRIRAIETGARPPRRELPFGVEALDQALPAGGIALGALHEVAPGGGGGAGGPRGPPPRRCLRPASSRAARAGCSGA